MSKSSVLAVCLAINVASLFFQIVVFICSGYGHAGMAAYTFVAVLHNAQAWELSSKIDRSLS
jgi:hypothetical protein